MVVVHPASRGYESIGPVIPLAPGRPLTDVILEGRPYSAASLEEYATRYSHCLEIMTGPGDESGVWVPITDPFDDGRVLALFRLGWSGPRQLSDISHRLHETLGIDHRPRDQQDPTCRGARSRPVPSGARCHARSGHHRPVGPGCRWHHRGLPDRVRQPGERGRSGTTQANRCRAASSTSCIPTGGRPACSTDSSTSWRRGTPSARSDSSTTTPLRTVRRSTATGASGRPASATATSPPHAT
jgi:hypothetical protein